MTLLIVCGLSREADAVPGSGFARLVSGGRRSRLELHLSRTDPTSMSGVVSFGLAGGLEPGLGAGDIVIADEVRSEDRSYPCSVSLVADWIRRAETAGIPLASGRAMLGVDAPVASAAEKAALRARTGAAALDMESHIVADWATRHALPFGVLRVISDAADGTIPPAAIAAMREDGGIDVAAVMRSLVRNPGQIPALIRTARDGAAAFRMLRRAASLLA
ncbi:phosphorylase [Enterovirga rhinocerotis]|uniref:Hopanoid-associated phosphorylase n=1 Tax=Enterovirga rhinocerotis TaxID=1339210 RepID=A0A4R7C900_9HYPH|nr:phosphorylase [Enterovirga rhinocerotis]TDR94482.1 hopanoid-associated phosphorylase [Enterovirga rhinocerotis]